MFLIDDLLLAPMKGILGIFREIHDAAQQELAGEGEAITASLSELYMKLETGQITEAEFEAREKELLDRLEKLQAEQDSEDEPAVKPARRPGKVRRRSRKGLTEVKPAAIV